MEHLTDKEQNDIEAIGQLLEGFTAGKTDQFDTLVPYALVNHIAPEGEQDKMGFKEIIKMVHGIFSPFDHLDHKPEVLFVKGDMVAGKCMSIGIRSTSLANRKY